MKIDRLVKAPEATGAFRARLLMLCFFFALGGALGSAVHGITENGNEQLREYITQYAALSAGEKPAAALLSVLVVYLRYPLLVYLCGFATLGLAMIPLLCAMQGFSLMFSVCCFTAALGRDGIVLALAAFGIRCFVTLPCLLYLAAQSMERSFRRTAAGRDTGKRQAVPGRTIGPELLCLMILLFGIAAELTAVPGLIQLAMAGI